MVQGAARRRRRTCTDTIATSFSSAGGAIFEWVLGLKAMPEVEAAEGAGPAALPDGSRPDKLVGGGFNLVGMCGVGSAVGGLGRFRRRACRYDLKESLGKGKYSVVRRAEVCCARRAARGPLGAGAIWGGG